MRASIVWTVLQREWFETVHNRLLMSTILILPILLTVAPILLSAALGRTALPPELAEQVLAQRPEWAGYTRRIGGAFAVQQFLVFFLLMPAYIPLSIATFSIIGEKQARSLEPVLAAPIRTSELLAGKAVAALVPGVLAGWATYAIFVVLASLVYGPALFGVVTDPSWLTGVFLLGPAVGLVGRGRRHRQCPRQRPARGPADRRCRDHPGDRAGAPAGDRHAAGRPRRIHRAGAHRARDLSRRVARGCAAVRPRGDPDPLALTQRPADGAGSVGQGPVRSPGT